jgi:hypothetical protein
MFFIHIQKYIVKFYIILKAMVTKMITPLRLRLKGFPIALWKPSEASRYSSWINLAFFVGILAEGAVLWQNRKVH